MLECVSRVVEIFSYIAVIIGVWIAVWSFVRDNKERRISQARLVYSKAMSLSLYEPNDPIPSLLPQNTMERGDAVPGQDVLDPNIFNYIYVDGQALCHYFVIRSEIEVSNQSDELIGPVVLEIGRSDLEKAIGPFIAEISAIEPKSAMRVVFTMRNPFDGSLVPAFAPHIRFRDSAGRWWSRIETNPVSETTAWQKSIS